jgi:hypothetical protein
MASVFLRALVFSALCVNVIVVILGTIVLMSALVAMRPHVQTTVTAVLQLGCARVMKAISVSLATQLALASRPSTAP